MTQKKINLSDAICYESSILYSTDAKLLWESVDYLCKLRKLSHFLKVPMFHSKYRDVRRAKTLIYYFRLHKTFRL